MEDGGSWADQIVVAFRSPLNQVYLCTTIYDVRRVLAVGRCSYTQPPEGDVR